MKTIIIKNQQSDKNGITVYGNYNRTKKNPDGLLFATAILKKPFKENRLNTAITMVIHSIIMCDKWNIKTVKDFFKIKKNTSFSISDKEKEKYYKNNIKLKFEVDVGDFEFKL